MEDKKIRTPLVSVLKRDKLPTYKAIIIRIATFIFTFLLSMLFCFFIIKENYFEIIGTLFSGALITETLFGIPGIGYASYYSMTAGDIPFSMFYLVFMAIMTLLGNLITDVLYAVVDPRVRVS